MVAAVLFISLVVFIFLNIPISISLGLSSVLALIASGSPLGVIPSMMQATVQKFSLLTIPLFVLAGVLMDKGGISKRLINLADSMMGPVHGGLGYISVICALFFAAISGSGTATVAAMGSILFIIYGMITGESISDLFLAGIVPGIIFALILCLTVLYYSVKNDWKGDTERSSGKEILKAFLNALPGFLSPVIVLGGIYSGIFTPTEAAAVAVIKYIMLIIINIVFLMAGCVMDNTSALYILVPIIMPIAKALGIDMIHLGVILVLNLSIGQVTPPVGPNLYVAADIGKVKFEEICRKMVPLLLMSIAALLIITYVPWLTTCLIK